MHYLKIVEENDMIVDRIMVDCMMLNRMINDCTIDDVL